MHYDERDGLGGERERGRKAATCNLFDEQDDGTMGDHVCMDR
jgi:hypothetical protein